MKVQNKSKDKKSKRRIKENIIEEIKFDESSRKEYLTGFHKRNVEKKKQAVLKAKEKQKQERLELRKETRKARLSELNQKFNLAEQEKSDEEPTSKIQDENIEFNGDQVKTTVTLISDLNQEEDYSPAILMQRLREKARNAEEQQDSGEEESDEQGEKRIKNRKNKIKYETKANRKKEHKKNKQKNTKTHRK